MDIDESRRQRIQCCNYLFKLRPLLPQRLRTIGFVPNVRFFELALDFGQAFRLAVVVKDTPLTPTHVQ
jgi:hypothetical protein